MKTDDADCFCLPDSSRQGWPWDNVGPELPETMNDGRAWPKISVVTPNYNYGHFLEETMRSVLQQGYPNLEYILIDGGSTDHSVALIRAYEKGIAFWESKKDRGQAHAINKGFAKATGDIVAWINSDDLLLPGALQRIAEAYDPENETLLLGNVMNFSPDGEQEAVIQKNVKLENFIGIPGPGFIWHQPGIFVPRSFLQRAGSLDEDLHFIFDWEWMCRLLIICPDVEYVDAFVAGFRVHDASKTGVGLMECWQEATDVVRRHNQHLAGVPARKVVAFYHLRMASLYFCEHAGGEHYWSRVGGVRSLLHAALTDFRVLFEQHFIRLLIRALLPQSWYRSS